MLQDLQRTSETLSSAFVRRTSSAGWISVVRRIIAATMLVAASNSIARANPRSGLWWICRTALSASQTYGNTERSMMRCTFRRARKVPSVVGIGCCIPRPLIFFVPAATTYWMATLRSLAVDRRAPHLEKAASKTTKRSSEVVGTPESDTFFALHCAAGLLAPYVQLSVPTGTHFPPPV